MAVRHGYGKIAGTDALVFAYDTGDTRNSYRGEPTENLANTDSLRTMGQYADNTVTSAEAPEKGPGWKKVTITARGTNFRTAKFPYINHPTNTTRTYSLEVDFNGTSGYYVRGDGFSGLGPNIYTSGVHSWTFTTTTNSGSMALFLNNGATSVTGINDVIYYRYYQVENNAHRTQFTAGTRSATQGLLDLTGNYTLDISNASFDSNAFITFDGSSDYVDILNSTTLFSGTQDFTVEAAYNMQGQGGGEIFGNYGSGYTTNHLWFSGMYGIWINGGVYAPGNPLPNGKYHMAATRRNGLVELYLNGELVNSGTKNDSIATDINYRIGADVNGAAEPFTGDIYVVKAYSRALTAAEVKSNFNHYKSRFGI
jgi:hypothetical protein